MHDNGDYTGALKSYGEALKIDSKSTAVLYEIAYTYHAIKDYDKTISYCNKVLELPFSEDTDDAYLLIGNSLDLADKPKEAVEIYKKALTKVKPTYLLYYNLAVTYYGMEQYENTEVELQNALKLNPQHASSHLLLSKAMEKKGNRVKTLLALYNFLLLEPTSERAVNAFVRLETLRKEGVKKESEKNITITLSNSNDEFSAAELMLSMSQASNLAEINKGKTAGQLFFENTKSFFATLSELKKEQSNFWWNFYVDFFSDMQKKNHTETFCYFISLANEDANSTTDSEAKVWLTSHDQSITDFDNWYEKVVRQF
ncbi:Beta-barrel assembly-enhancing protease [compost metagenome]